MRRVRLLLLLLLLPCFVFAQKQQEIDSLVAVLPHMKADTNKVNLLNKISWNYSEINPVEGIRYGDLAFTLAEKLGFKSGIALAMSRLGVNYSNSGNNSKALGYYLESMKMSEAMRDKHGIAVNANNIAALYSEQGNYTGALEYYQKALKIFEVAGNKHGISVITGNIGSIYNDQGNYPKALEYYQRALRIHETTGNKQGIAFNINGMGMVYRNQRNYIKALEYYSKALNIFERIEDKNGIAVSSGSIGILYKESNDYAKALEYYGKSLRIYEALGNKDGIARMMESIGVIYDDQGNAVKALEYYTKVLKIREEINDQDGIANTTGNIGIAYLHIATGTSGRSSGDAANRARLIADAIERLERAAMLYKEIGLLNYYQKFSASLSEAYEANGDFVNAYKTYKEHTLYKDSVFNDAKRNEITRLEIGYEFARKEDSLKYINELSSSRLQQQILLGQQQEQALLLSNKEKDLQHLNFLKTQADLQLEKQAKERQQALAIKEQQLHTASLMSLGKDNTLNKLKLRQQWLYSIAGLLLLAGAGSFFFYRNRVQQARLKAELAREKAEQERSSAEFQSKMSDAALSSLRSQMNPHFIFNCLNSIRLYAAKNDSVSATSYLSRFSRLMRLVLENSKSELITLKQEEETLRLYLDMEGMRFKDKLEYEIITDSNIDKEYLEMPPMLVQPYVENAIWHGLMHQEGGGRIIIRFSEADDMLTVSVRDNGVGRVKAAALKSESAPAHKSFGMNITNERLALINRKHSKETSVVVNDLYDNGKAAGTEVIVSIPV